MATLTPRRPLSSDPTTLCPTPYHEAYIVTVLIATLRNIHHTTYGKTGNQVRTGVGWAMRNTHTTPFASRVTPSGLTRSLLQTDGNNYTWTSVSATRDLTDPTQVAIVWNPEIHAIMTKQYTLASKSRADYPEFEAQWEAAEKKKRRTERRYRGSGGGGGGGSGGGGGGRTTQAAATSAMLARLG